MTGGIIGHLLAWERHERDGSRWAWVSWVQESGGRHDHKVVQVRAGSVRPLEPPGAYKQVPRRVLGGGGQIRGTSRLNWADHLRAVAALDQDVTRSPPGPHQG
jgi:hypothetical protein